MRSHGTTLRLPASRYEPFPLRCATGGTARSDLLRAAQTAEIIGDLLDVEVTLDPDLREKSYGVAEGRARSWLDERFVPPPAAGERLDHHEGIEGAETRRELGVRVYRALETILARRIEHQIVVTHGFAMTMLVSAWIGMPLDSASRLAFRSTSGGIAHLRQDDLFGNRGVQILNDTRHLEE